MLGQLTSRGRGLRVGEQDYTGLALVHKCLQAGLGAIIGLDLAAEAVERHDVAHRGRLGSSRGGAIGLRRGLLGLARHGGLHLGRSLGDLGGLLRWGLRRRRRGLALAELDRHDGK